VSIILANSDFCIGITSFHRQFITKYLRGIYMDEEKISFDKVYATHSIGFYRGWVVVKIETGGYDYPYYAFWPDIELPEEDLESLIQGNIRHGVYHRANLCHPDFI
jgi:hypothetical protein